MVDDVRDDHPDIFGALVFEADSDIVRLVIVQPGKSLDFLLGIRTDFLAVLQRFGNCGNGYIQFPGNIF